jgi:hypothetical protein
MTSNPRAIWNAVALVSTLALAAVVAVVAVARSDREAAKATPSPSSASPSPSPSPTEPGELGGKGPFVVFSTSDVGVVAYDLDSGVQTRLGSIKTSPVIEGSRQPGTGRLVAFPTEDGTVWQVTRKGLAEVGSIPRSAGTTFLGRAASPDGRRLATLALEPAPALVLVDLADGRVEVKRGGFRGDEPEEPLLPVGWSLGGTIVYQVPFCRCETWTPGLWAVDLEAESIAVVPGTRSDQLGRFVMTQEGQSLLYGTEGPPFSLRRVASGQRGADVIRQSRDASLSPLALSPDGRLALLERKDPRTGRIRFEMAEADTGDAVTREVVSRIPSGAFPLALLSDEIAVVSVPGASGPNVILVREDRIIPLASSTATGADPVYLGWLR